MRPGEHPYPPEDLDERELPIRVVDDTWFRVHSTRHHPIYYGRSGQNRFDSPSSEYGTMYLGRDAHCSIVETIDFVPTMNVIAVSSVSHLSLARVTTSRPLRLVDLTADGLVRLGADARLTTGSYEISKRWSHGFWSHSSNPDGLLYRSRHDPSRMSAAMFDRTSDVVSVTSISHFSDEETRQMLSQIFADYGFLMIED